MITTDIWFASYLLLKSVPLKDYKVVSRGKGQFVFDVSDEDWKAHKLAFRTSEANALAQYQKQLKDLLY